MSLNHPCVIRTATALLLFSVACGGPAVLAKDQKEDTTVRIYKKVAPSTVFISSAYFTRHSVTRASSNGIGSGVLINDQGEIVTNAHVVDGAAKIMVLLHDGTRLPAEVVGIDGETDIALLSVKLPKKHPPFAQIGDSDRVEVGETVLAIGHPFGLGYALTTGVVSGFGTSPMFGLDQEAVLQTSAAINPGNSGGPLVNLEGKVIGLNASVLMGAQNIGFAIPINTVKSIVAELRSHGRVIRPWLGIKATLLSEEVINLFTLPLVHGWLVEDIDEGSPAEKAGLLAGDLNVTIEGVPWVLGGDIIQKINGEDVTTAEQHAETLKKLKVGDLVELSIVRDGARQKILAKVQERPRAQVLGSKAKEQEEITGPPVTHQSGEVRRPSRKIRF